MGGGDLNSKKSWHPNTLKNQERVWKAEQAAAEEKKRVLELQREHAEERNRAELNDIINKNNSGSGSDNHLSWMYDKPDKKVEQEEYLLGKALNKNSDQPQNVVQDPIPAVSRRVVGSSMLTAAGDTQVDMSRKIREDPLVLIKERERAARAALLNNPLQRRKLTQLLRKEQDQRNESKLKRKSKKKDKDLDDLLAAKLNALGGQKRIDLATLLNSSDDSSSDVEVKRSKKKKRKKHKIKKSKKHKNSSDDESDERVSRDINKNSCNKSDKNASIYQSDKYSEEFKKRRSKSPRQTSTGHKEHREAISDDRKKYYKASHKYASSTSKYDKSHEKPSSSRRSPIDRKRKRDLDNRDNKKACGISEAEKTARLAEMAAAGAEREVQRGRRVAEQRAADEYISCMPRAGSRRLEARALPESLESRIHSNRHYIQRDKRYMNENFARR